MRIKFLLLLVSCIFSAIISYSQVSPCRTIDFNLQGYPKSVRYLKFESDSSLKQQRVSYIEDYQLFFDADRLLTERVYYINGQRDRSVKYEYNNKRQLVKETVYEKDNRIACTTEYTYNNIGRLSGVTEISYPQSRAGANTTERTEIYTYNSRGLLTEKDIHSDNIYANKNIKYYCSQNKCFLFKTINQFMMPIKENNGKKGYVCL